MELGQLVFGNPTQEFALERNDFSDVFHEFLDRIGLSCYGHSVWNKTFDTQGDQYATIRNDTFVVRPYNWGDCTCSCGDRDDGPHSDDCALTLPNFEHFPSGLKITWYKYALRGAYANRELDLDEFQSLLTACVQSLGPNFDIGKPQPDIAGNVRFLTKGGFARFATIETGTGTVRLHVAGRVPGSEHLTPGKKVAIATRDGKPNRSVVYVDLA